MGPGVIHRRFFVGWMAGLAAVALGCNGGSRNDFQNTDAGIRIAAIRQAAAQNDMRCVPLLVDRLEDEDEAVRFYAILALERLTGDRKGYLYYRRPESQTQAIERWRQYVRERAPALAATHRIDAAPASQPQR